MAGGVPVAGGYSALMGGAGSGGFGRALGGALGGFGQGMMDQNMRRTYGTARAGGYHDLMENNQIQDFVTGDNTQGLQMKFQDILGRMGGARRGQQPMPGAPGGMQK